MNIRSFIRSFDRTGIGYWIAGVYFVSMAVIGFKYHVIGDYGVETDFYAMVPLSKRISEGELVISDWWGPLYFIVLAGVEYVTGDFFEAGLWIGLTSASVVICFTYKLLSRLYRRDIALVVTLLLAFNPTFVRYTYSSGTDMLFGALATLSIYYYLKQEELTWGHFVIAAIFASLAYLTRYNGLFLIAGLVLGLLLLKANWKKRVVAFAVVSGVFFTMITPWGLHCLKEKGAFFYNTNYKNIAFEVYGTEEGEWWDDSAFQSFSDVILRDPVLFLKTIGYNVYRHFVKDMDGDFMSDMDGLMGWHIGFFVIPGLILSILAKPTSEQSVYYLFNFLFFAILLTVFHNPRFSMFLIPFYVILALQSIVLLNRRIERKWFLPAAGTILILWTFIVSYQFNGVMISSGPEEILLVAEAFKEHIPHAQGESVVARKPHIGYYLDMEFKGIPAVKTYDALMTELRKMDANYLYFSLIEAHLRPHLRGLLNWKGAPPGLTPIMSTEYPPSVLYGISPQTEPKTITVALPGGALMEMVWIEPGEFMMGSPEDETGREDGEGPQHRVTISRGFWLGKYEITQAQWESAMGKRPWAGQEYVQEDPNHPAVHISWDDVQALVAKLSEVEGSEVYRLPTEAEWEYTCRAGTTTRWSFGEDQDWLPGYAWYHAFTWGLGEKYAHAVGTRLPNPWGLYDMHGNVWEWVQGWYGAYSSDAQTDPAGPASGSDRALRGGSFGYDAQYLRSALRGFGPPGSCGAYIGARLLRQGL